VNDRRVGFTPVPDDADLEVFFADLIRDNEKVLGEILSELDETLAFTVANDEPRLFAYGKLLNYLASLDKNSRVHICAAALWKIKEMSTNGT
jgi:hypothetical protein